MLELTEQEVERIAKTAADEAVDQLFLHLGVDLNDKDQMSSLKYDLAHLHRWRKSTDTIKRQSLTAAVTFVVAGLMGALWLIFRGTGSGP